MNIASYIEHSNLSPTLVISDIDRLVSEAMEYGFYGVCVPPFWVKRAQREIGNSGVKLITVAGFPFGYSMTETKLDEIHRAIDNGVDEIDMVMNLSSFKTGIPWTKIEIAKCSKAAHEHSKLLKVIIETSYLSIPEIENATRMCADAGADFVKTSTGFSGAGASPDGVRVMRNVLPEHVGIKASGGIRTLEDANACLQAGANRIGTSSGISICSTS